MRVSGGAGGSSFNGANGCTGQDRTTTCTSIHKGGDSLDARVVEWERAIISASVSQV